MFLNPLLNLYSANGLGLRIGNVFLGSPVCADGLLFLARSAVELQDVLESASEFVFCQWLRSANLKCVS